MSKDNQIEEMAKATMKHCEIDNQCGTCYWSTCNECLAEILYNAGYRKQKEVAREIFEEIDGITELFAKGLIEELEMYDKLAELKKKYTEAKK